MKGALAEHIYAALDLEPYLVMSVHITYVACVIKVSNKIMALYLVTEGRKGVLIEHMHHVLDTQ